MSNNLLSAQTTSDFGLDGRQLLEILRRRAWLVAAVTLVAPALAFVYLSRQAPIFQAQTSVIIEAATPQYLGQSFRDIVDVENSWWSAQENRATQSEILRSRMIMLATAETLCGGKPLTTDGNEWAKTRLPDGRTITDYLTGNSTCTPEVLDQASRAILGRIDILPGKDSKVMSVLVKDANPQAAAIIANVAAEVFKQKNLERRLEKTEGAASWLGDEAADLTSQLNASEKALVDFKKQNNILSVALEDQQNELTQRRHKIVEELTSVQLKLIALGAQRDQYQRLRSSDPLTDTSPQLQDNPVIQKLKESYAQEYQKLIELRGKYLEKHPLVVAQQERLNAVRDDIKRESQLSLKALDESYEATNRQEKVLSQELEKTTHQGIALEQRAIEYNKLKRNFERLQKLSEQVGGREKESSLASHLKTNNVWILDHALVPEAAIKPNALVVSSVAMVVGFIVGFALAFLLDFIDATVKSPEDIEERLRLPFLGVIPRIHPSEKEAAGPGPIELYIHGRPHSPVAECCRAVRTSLVFMSPDKPLRRLLVTSGEPQEGKSTTAVNLAITMAQSGQRVCLIDTDMRRPRMHKIFKVKATAGFSTLVAGESTIDQSVFETTVPNLFIIPCGPIPPYPAELLQSERCKKVVSELSERFDRVLFDSPPLAVVTDAAILSQLCDGTVLVARARKTPREMLQRANKQLASLNSHVLGCILNSLDLQDRVGYGYRYYNYAYRSYYGEDEATKAASRGTTG